MTGCGVVAVAALLLLPPGLHQQPELRPLLRELLILDVDGNGVCLVPPESGIALSLMRGGPKATMAWTCKGSDDAFVVIDFNTNGRVDSREELVGGALGPPNGLDYLSVFDGRSTLRVTGGSSQRDAPEDGIIDSRDGVFGELILWTDTNHDGASQEDELQGMAWSGISRLDLARLEMPPGLVQREFAPLTHRIRVTRTGKSALQRDMYAVRLAVRPAA